ncbi:protein HEAT INTOLERANT 4 [Sesamum angolense]|uniref:Protein HEAT INTOLERANT 4 n=1 Tax=Sesamum angolense TaxID=2727404 RepID=A0AAE1T8E2_9LAMI|nr:protein HEAT INTOLERANT 4 [Sesamum angolense]
MLSPSRAREAAKGRRKRAKVSKPETEPEYFPEKRNLEDLWEQVFPVGTEWDQLDMVYQYKWNFSNLELNWSLSKVKEKLMIPVVVAVVSPFPPSDKIGIKSVQRETEEIVPMKQMKMDWFPYIPLEKRESQVERLKIANLYFELYPEKWSKDPFASIDILHCKSHVAFGLFECNSFIQQAHGPRAGLKHLKIDRVKKFEYCLPYFYHPFQEDEIEQSTIVELLFPIDPKPVFCEFDWELDELEEFTDKLIEEEELPADQKEPFKDFVKEKVREAKKANREARETRKRTLAEMSEETRAAFENMRFYKFYPVPSPDTPDVSSVKKL